MLAAWNLVLVNPGRQALHPSGLAHREPELGSFNLQQKRHNEICYFVGPCTRRWDTFSGGLERTPG